MTSKQAAIILALLEKYASHFTVSPSEEEGEAIATLAAMAEAYISGGDIKDCGCMPPVVTCDAHNRSVP